jgi:hypothetical protein
MSRAPIIVALTDDYAASVTAFLQGYLRRDDLTVETVRKALELAARDDKPAEPRT